MFFLKKRLDLFNTACLLFVGVLFSISVCAVENQKIDEIFILAEEIKSTDFNRFSELVTFLSEQSDQLSPAQVEELEYLQSYRLVYSGKRDESFVRLRRLAENSTSENLKFKSYGLMINSLVLSRKYSEVFQYFDDFHSLLGKITDEGTRSYGFVIIALVFNSINQFDLGLYYAEKLIETTKVDRYRCIGMQFKVEALHRAKRYQEFYNFYEEAINNCIAAKQPVYVGIIRSFRIEQLVEQSPQQALEALNAYFNEVEATSYKILITLYRALYSSIYLKLGQTDLALSYGLAARKNLDVSEINYAVLRLYSALHEAAKTSGDYQQALNFHEILVTKQKAFEDEKTSGLLAYNIAKANIEVKNQRIALLDKDNELLSLQKDLFEQEAKQNRLLILILAFVLAIATIFAYKGMTGRKRFKKIAEYDQLTGISNRYHFNNQAKIALDYCENNAKPVAVMLFDLDFFKTINDTHGHAAGDWALQHVVKTCRNFMRNNDVFGRIGGEEFAVVLPGCHTDKAVLLAEICRDAIAAIDSSDSGKQFPLSASFGVAGSDTSGYQLKQLLADADHAMYQAKESGRDKVAAYADYRSVV
ncbi:MAG: GGDEF domain-containing protein [Gammaproteobacteria bacterium]|nr:GGDEF domain-containing protein [Gammaproteobacteria bacterium]MBU1556575.1 GGDEF domain-containing protein [Gammaproteobacteria bacterium]MBU2072615.1 GGDEF domain-containing protein [Gammaproteobacteria bacterium]MBU2182251.1 GGDEF domain-containing protein [Gammaproteobacteria bacterium]MBU2207169.1 GGDEF domain-containing protein [Gammaproteobacteria bacterium]